MPVSSRHLRCSLVAFAIGAAGLGALPAEAAGQQHRKTVRQVANVIRPNPGVIAPAGTPSLEAKAAALKTGSSEPAGVWTSGEQERACFRGRRKLWQPGEGWVVKKVNLCP